MRGRPLGGLVAYAETGYVSAVGMRRDGLGVSMNRKEVLLYFALTVFGNACTRAAVPPTVPPGSSALSREPSSSRDRQAKQALGGEEIAGVVRDAKPKIESECWQPALDARRHDVPMPVQVMARIQVAAAGNVAEVEVSDSPPELTGLSPCIATALRQLRFRATEEATAVNVPFTFDVRTPAP